MNKKDVKKNLLNHSEAKVKLLGDYLKRYLNIISNDGYTEGIEIYDLFCGEGIYNNGGEGSPMVIMRAIKDVHFINVAKSNSIPSINCFFNDLNSSKVKRAEESIINKSLYYERFGKLEFSSIDYKDYLKKLELNLKDLKKEKAFIFIDPYEYKHIKIHQIKNLLANKKTEVLLWLPTQFMYRFEANGTPQALKDFIEELVPYKDWKSSDSVWSFVNELNKSFQKAIGPHFFVDYFTIQKDINTVFCLFFFSPHIKGFEKMLETKWMIDSEQGKGWCFSGNQPSLFFDQKNNQLEELLLEFLKSGSKTNGELYEFTLNQRYLPKHSNEILNYWQQNDRIDVNLENGRKARKGAFYIAYKYFYRDFSKVSIILK